jgi:hypothetical protein
VTLNAHQQKELDSALAALKDTEEDHESEARANGPDYPSYEECFYDYLEAVAWDIKDPEVRKELHRMHGAYDRQTGHDPLDGV